MRKVRSTPTGNDTSIHGGKLYFEDAVQCDVDSPQFAEIIGDGYTKSIRVVSLAFRWLETDYIGWDAKITTDVNVQMTLRREVKSGRGYWYAYRRVMGKLHKKYVGQDDQIDEKKLLEIARKMPTI